MKRNNRSTIVILDYFHVYIRNLEIRRSKYQVVHGSKSIQRTTVTPHPYLLPRSSQVNSRASSKCPRIEYAQDPLISRRARGGEWITVRIQINIARRGVIFDFPPFCCPTPSSTSHQNPPPLNHHPSNPCSHTTTNMTKTRLSPLQLKPSLVTAGRRVLQFQQS